MSQSLLTHKLQWRGLLLLVGLSVLTGCGSPPGDIDYSGPTSEWLQVGGSEQRQQFTPLTQISKDNVKDLEVAWIHNSGDYARESDGSGLVTAMEASPLVVDDTLYYCTPYDRVFALDPETGEERWVYDPKINSEGVLTHICRGVSYWEDEQASADQVCRQRIYVATVDARLIGLDAKTGKPCEDFGDKGTVDLMHGVGDEFRNTGSYPTSPPLVINNKLVAGAMVVDNQSSRAAAGVVRAFDTRTGELTWAFDPVPPSMDPVTVEDVANGEIFTPSTPNSWGLITGDPKSGIVYVPMGNQANDFWGGEERGGLDYYGTALVALDADTGEVLWHFKVVNHDLWDYDIAAQPVPYEQVTDAGKVPAVIVATKMGHIFLLNAKTGEPLFPVEERPVPQTDVPGEYTAPTQPFPTKPAPLMPDLEKDDFLAIFGFVGRGECEDLLKKFRYEGIFTPPSLKGSLQFPGPVGGVNWGAVSLNPQTNVAIMSYHRFPFIMTLVPREEGQDYAFPQHGAPYATLMDLFGTSYGAPCVQPPWSYLTAIDMNTGEQLWNQPFGTLENMVPMGGLFPWGGMALGGNLQTATGLSFIGATMDNQFRAFDSGTGELLWEVGVPYAAHAMPMSYRLKKNSKQYIVIASGGKGLFESIGSQTGDSLIAYSLPD